jgi:hypothetical protein
MYFRVDNVFVLSGSAQERASMPLFRPARNSPIDLLSLCVFPSLLEISFTPVLLRLSPLLPSFPPHTPFLGCTAPPSSVAPPPSLCTLLPDHARSISLCVALRCYVPCPVPTCTNVLMGCCRGTASTTIPYQQGRGRCGCRVHNLGKEML